LIFGEWCKVQAESSRLLAEQLEKLALTPMVQREKQKAAAFSIVAMELAAAREEYSVKSEDIGEVLDATELANPGFRWEKK
jgi:hypothetical protein